MRGANLGNGLELNCAACGATGINDLTVGLLNTLFLIVSREGILS